MSLWKRFREMRRPALDVSDYAVKLKEKGLKLDGTMDVSNVPIAPPIGYKKQPSMVEIVRDMVRSERLRQAALDSGHETFEEADDFDVGDDPDVLRSPYENEFDPPVEELMRVGREELARREREKVAEATGKVSEKSGGAGGTPPAGGAPGAPEAP